MSLLVVILGEPKLLVRLVAVHVRVIDLKVDSALIGVVIELSILEFEGNASWNRALLVAERDKKHSCVWGAITVEQGDQEDVH